MGETITIERVLRLLGGSSASTLVSSNKGLFVVKYSRDDQGPNLLANELLGTELMMAVGLPVPKWHFARANSDSSRELLFASEFVQAASSGKTYELLPSHLIGRLANRNDFVGALVFDLWAGATHVRQALYVEDPKLHIFRAVFIDQGHLFGGPHWALGPMVPRGCLDHAIYGCSIEDDICRWAETLRILVPSALAEIFDLVPDAWYKGDLQMLADTLLARLPQVEANAVRLLAGSESMAQKGRTAPEHLQRLFIKGISVDSIGLDDLA